MSSINQFDLLDVESDDEKSPSPQPGQKAQSKVKSPKVESTARTIMYGNTQYILSYGKEEIMQASLPAASKNYLTAWFFGRCYYCRVLGHSQKFCPLRYCKICRTYSHTENVCEARHKFRSHHTRSPRDKSEPAYFFDTAE